MKTTFLEFIKEQAGENFNKLNAAGTDLSILSYSGYEKLSFERLELLAIFLEFSSIADMIRSFKSWQGELGGKNKKFKKRYEAYDYYEAIADHLIRKYNYVEPKLWDFLSLRTRRYIKDELTHMLLKEDDVSLDDFKE